VNFGVPEEYEESHIPGALYLDTNRLESSHDWNRRSPEELEQALCSLGITRDTTVVLYGRDTEGDANEKWPGRRAGQIAASRAAMILRYSGVDDVRLLDGGYDWWVRAGYPLETVVREPTPVSSFGVQIPLRPEVIVDIDEAKQILADREHAALVSVRTWNEHIGKVSGYNYINPAGRIAGDIWGNCGSDAYHMQHYRNVDSTSSSWAAETAASQSVSLPTRRACSRSILMPKRLTRRGGRFPQGSPNGSPIVSRPATRSRSSRTRSTSWSSLGRCDE